MKKEDIKKILLKNKEIFEKYRIKRLGIFDSFLKGTNKKNSDIDLLVEFNEVIDLFEFVHIGRQFKKIFGVKVDLVTPGALKPYIKDKILKEVNWF